MRNSLVDAELIDSVNQIIRLRWLAGIGVLVVTLAAGPLFDVTAPTSRLMTVGVFILLYNMLFWGINNRLKKAEADVDDYQKLAIGQMVLDWIAMMLLIHFSGGIESPAIYFFLFHLIIYHRWLGVFLDHTSLCDRWLFRSTSLSKSHLRNWCFVLLWLNSNIHNLPG
jgi:hypothetical protein